MILEHRSRKEFRIDGSEKTYQVCDNVCYQMFRLQNAMYTKTEEGKSTVDHENALKFINDFLLEQETAE